MRRVVTAPLVLLLLAGETTAVHAQPVGGASPVARLEEVDRRVGGGIRPTLRREGTSRGRTVRLSVPVAEGCTSVMLAVEPPGAAVRLQVDGRPGERTGEGIWEAQTCPGSLLPARATPPRRRSPLVLDAPAGTRWALWAFPIPGLLAVLGPLPVPPSPPDVLAALAAQMPRHRARVRIADVATEGSLGAADARRVLSIVHGLLDCWRDPVETDPTLAGDRAVLFVVGPTGTVTAVSVSRPVDTLVAARATECTTERLRTVRFPAASNGATTRVRAVLEVRAVEIAAGQ